MVFCWQCNKKIPHDEYKSVYLQLSGPEEKVYTCKCGSKTLFQRTRQKVKDGVLIGYKVTAVEEI